MAMPPTTAVPTPLITAVIEKENDSPPHPAAEVVTIPPPAIKEEEALAVKIVGNQQHLRVVMETRDVKRMEVRGSCQDQGKLVSPLAAARDEATTKVVLAKPVIALTIGTNSREGHLEHGLLVRSTPRTAAGHSSLPLNLPINGWKFRRKKAGVDEEEQATAGVFIITSSPASSLITSPVADLEVATAVEPPVNVVDEKRVGKATETRKASLTSPTADIQTIGNPGIPSKLAEIHVGTDPRKARETGWPPRLQLACSPPRKKHLASQIVQEARSWEALSVPPSNEMKEKGGSISPSLVVRASDEAIWSQVAKGEKRHRRQKFHSRLQRPKRRNQGLVH
ncbi:unnamed protein product [Linum trigynum]|uniref:Uncharacterized protein n=1 Tax=Linum trigynum TaxID=586398 RepID=A0AAV2D9L9_9ROSI